jgi:hypothetical protein
MATRALALTVLLIACHQESPPAHPGPGDTPPLPPSSGTPIGYLLDDADLHLRDEQRTRLHDIDATLAAELEALETRERAARPASASESQNDPPQNMGGGRRGGRGGGGAGGRRGGRSRQASTGPTPNAAPKPDAGAVGQERAADVREAFHRAFSVLDPEQQRRAHQLLADHDIDVDTSGSAVPGERSSSEPTEPTEP